MRKLIPALLLLLLSVQNAYSYHIITDVNLFYSFFTQPHKTIDFNILKDGTSFAQASNSPEQTVTYRAKPDCLATRKDEIGSESTAVRPNAFSSEWSFLSANDGQINHYCRAVMWFDQGISSGHHKMVVIAASGKSKPFVLYTNKGFLGIVPDNSKETVFIFDGFSAVFGFETEFIEASPVPDSDRSFVARLRARAKITSHFRRRCILPGGVVQVWNMLDIPALSRLASQAPRHLQSVN